MTPKRITDTVLNMATMGAFAIPETGPVIAAGIGAATGLFDIFVPDIAIPTGLQSLDKQDLENAVSEMKNALADDLFNNDVDNATTDIINFNVQLLANIAQAKSSLGLDKQTLFFPLDNTTQQKITKMDDYFAPDTTLFQKLRDDRDVITRSSRNDSSLDPGDLAKHRTQTTALYCLAGSGIVLYLKTAIAWQWAEEMLYCSTYPKWFAAEKAWNNASQAYRNNHPDLDPDNLYPGVKTKRASLPDWQDWVGVSPVQMLKDNVREILAYSIHDDMAGKDGLYTIMTQNWSLRTSLADAAALNAKGIWTVPLAATALYGGPNQTGRQLSFANAFCSDWTEVASGTAFLEAWETCSTKFALDNVAYGDLVLYHDSLGLWQDALDTVKFQTKTAVGQDTPRSIAQHYYNDASKFVLLRDPNDQPYPDGDAAIAGQRVKIPDLDTKRVAVPDLPPRT